MCSKEELNFFKISSLFLDVASTALAERIKLDCVKNNVSFEDFLNGASNKETLLHLWQPVKCCNPFCFKSSNKKILNDVQWKQLFTRNSVAGHIKRNHAGWISQTCTHAFTATNGITPDSLDVTLSSSLLLNICVLSSSEKLSVQKLRELRNCVFAHAKEANISENEFKQHWNAIETEIVCISSQCNSNVQSGIHKKLTDLKQLHYIDHETLQICLLNVKSYYEHNILEKFDEIKEVIYTNTPGYKVQKITEAEVTCSPLFISTRGFNAGIDSLLKTGVVIFTGKCGSGKTSTSLEILKQIKEGKILPNHKIQHISIENWESQIDRDQESVIFLEDPLGTTNSDEPLIKHDRGIFRKIFAFVELKKVKVILTVRSNIYQKNKTNLERHDIFQERFIVDLSDGEYALNDSEKKEFVTQNCRFWNVSIVLNDNEYEKGGYDKKTKNISQKTIQQILKSDPPIGYPLCCKLFFQNSKNLCLGAKFFNQPTDLLLEEMRDMMLSRDENDRRDVGLLMYMVMSGGEIDLDNIDHQKMHQVLRALSIHSCENINIRISLNALNNKHIKFESNHNQCEFSHITVLESVFITCCKQIPELIPDMLKYTDISVLCEYVRTSKDDMRNDEKVFILQEKYHKDLANRFFTEVPKRNFGRFVSHSSLNDDRFVRVFTEILKENDKYIFVCDENKSGETFFDVICLFNAFKLVNAILDARLIPETMIRHAASICIEFDNFATMKVLISRMSFEQIRYSFTSACTKNKIGMVQLLFEEAKDDLRQQDLSQGFVYMCALGNELMANRLLEFGVEEGLNKGFNEACKRGQFSMVKFLKGKDNIMTNVDLITAFLRACENNHIEIVNFLLTTFSTIDVKRALIKLCNEGNRSTISRVMQTSSVTDEILISCLLEICGTKNDFSTKQNVNETSNSVLETSTPVPYSVLNYSKSVPLKTPLTGNINLFPSLSNQPSVSKNQTVPIMGSNSHKIKAFLVKSVIEFRANHSTVLNRVYVKACELGITEVVYVLLKANAWKLDKSVVVNALLQICKNNDIETFDIVLSNTKISYVDVGDVCREIFVNNRIELMKSVIEKLSLDRNDFLDIYQKALSMGTKTMRDLILNQFRHDEEYIVSLIIRMCEEKCFRKSETILQSLNLSCGSLEKILIAATSHTTVYKKNKESISNSLTESSTHCYGEIAEVSFEQCSDILYDDIVKSLIHSQDECYINFIHTLMDRIIPSFQITDLQTHAIMSPFFDTFKGILGLRHYKHILSVLLRACVKLGVKYECCKQYVCMFKQEIRDFTSQQIYKWLMQTDNDKTIALQNLTNDQIDQFLQEYCSNDSYDKDLAKIILKKRKNLTTDQVYQCLKKYCSYEKSCENVVLDILRERKELTREEVYQRLKKYCSNGNYFGDSLLLYTLQERKQLTTDQVYQCLKMYCSYKKSCGNVVLDIHRESKDLTREEVCQRPKKYCSNGNYGNYFEDSLLLNILQERKDLTTEQVFECLEEGRLNGNHKGDSILNIIFDRKDLTTEQVYQCLKEYCSNTNFSEDILLNILQKQNDLTTEQVFKCLKECCLNENYDGDRIWDIICERKDLTSEQVFQCLKKCCSNSNYFGHSLLLNILKERKDLTTKQVFECLKEYCSNANFYEDVLLEILQERKDLTTEQVFECLKELCSKSNFPGQTLLEILQKRKDLTTEQVFECLKELCSKSNFPGQTLLEILQKRKDLTTEQVFECLKECCSNENYDGHLVLDIICKRKDLTTEQVFQCLKEYCSHGYVDEYFLRNILNERKDLSTEQVFECLKKCCSNGFFDEDSLRNILKERKDLTTEQVFECLKECCSHGCFDKDSLRNILKERKDLTTEQVFECLKECCSNEFFNEDYVLNILKERKDLTTEQVFECLKKCCSNGFFDEDYLLNILKERKDITTEKVFEFLKEYYVLGYFNEKFFLNILKERKDLTTEQVFEWFKKYCSHTNFNEDFFLNILEERNDLTTDQISQCLKEYCSNSDCSRYSLLKILQELKDLTTKQVFECLKEYCSNSDFPEYTLLKILQERKDLTTKQVFECLKEYCSNSDFPEYTLLKILQERKDLTTKQVFECLKKYCSHRHFDKDFFLNILRKRNDLTTEQVFECLKECCSNSNCFEYSLQNILHERKDLTSNQIYQCIKEFCSNILLNILQKRKHFTTRQVFQCLKKCCSNSNYVRYYLLKILQERKDLTTEQVFECLKEYCSNIHYNGVFMLYILRDRKDLTTEQVYQCLKEYRSNKNCTIDIVMDVLRERTDLTTEHMKIMMETLC